MTGFWPESNRGTADNPNLLSPALFSVELWWQMHHRKSFRTLCFYNSRGASGTSLEWRGLAATSQSLSPDSCMHIQMYADRMDDNSKSQNAYLNRRTHKFDAVLQFHCVQWSWLAWSANVATRIGRCGATQDWIYHGCRWDDPWFCRRVYNLELTRGRSHSTRQRLALFPGSKMFDGPKNFGSFSALQFDPKRTSHMTRPRRGRPMWGRIYMKNQSNSTLREKGSKTWICDIRCVPYNHSRDYTLSAFKVVRQQIRKRWPLVCLHAPSIGHTGTNHLRVEFLLKTGSGYLRDAEVTWFTLANP